MKKLNDARIFIKHKEFSLTESDIETSRVNSREFLIDNTPIIFKIEFSDISLIELIQNSEIRRILYDAQNFSKNKKFKDALELISIAFKILFSDYDNLIFDFDDLDDRDFEGEEIDFTEGIEKLNKILEKMQLKLNLLSLNIDNTKYIKFRILTPTLYRGKDIYDKYSVFWSFENKRVFKQEHYDFCLDFIIDCALKLQEFDSDFKDLELEETYFKYF